MTYDMINNEYHRRAKRGIYICDLGDCATATGAGAATLVSTIDPSTLFTERVKGVRPVGTGDKQTYNKSKATIWSKSKVANIFITKRR